MVDINKRVAASVRAERLRRGLTQEQLAAEASLHRTYIGRVESGAANVSLAALERIAAALGQSVVELIRDVPGAAES